MEILSTETIRSIVWGIKILFVVLAVLIIVAHLFYAKETEKMENKLQIFLPVGVHTAITIELVLEFVFLTISLIVLLLPW